MSRPTGERLRLESLAIGAHPLLDPLIERLGLRELLARALPASRRQAKLPALDSALVLIRNIALCRHPLYGVPEWARRFVPAQLALEPEQVALINDDRLGRTLDKLFVADRRSLVTALAVRLAHEFDLDLERLHNDSTSITFCGTYPQGPERADRRRAVRIVRGHNKDHRPHLKQLVWSLTVSADGAVPVHYNVFDGNVTDDQTHIETWQALRALVGSARFLYVADSKLCTRENMGFIAGQSGRFVTVLPRSRKEDARFKRWLVDGAPQWTHIWTRPPQRRRDDPPERFEAIEDPQRSAEGYRIVWYRSSEKWARDERARDQAIEQARFALHQLGERVGRRNLKTRLQVEQGVERILDETGAGAWVRVELIERERHRFRQSRPGRPGKNTRYVREATTVHEPHVTLDTDAIDAAAAADGVFPLITNVEADVMTPLELLTTYKYQAFVEKRHEQLKTVTEVAPVNYKSVERIEAFLFLYFIAITLHALLERELRRAMQHGRIGSLPLYPEERECSAPTADKILGLFDNLRRHRLFDGDQHVKTFWDELSETQRTVLELLQVPTSAYGQ